MKALQSRKGNVTGAKLHPNSRRAKQLQRVELRTKKLEIESRVRRSGEVGRVDRHLYFVHALPDDRTFVTLAELHQILLDYINRNDTELDELEAERKERTWRKGEGKSKREAELVNLKESEESEYRSGFVLPDLTLPTNVFLCRQWTSPLPSAKDPKGKAKGGDPSFLGRIRLIRIEKDDKEAVTVVCEGAREGEWDVNEGREDQMEVELAGDAGEDEEEEEDAEIKEP